MPCNHKAHTIKMGFSKCERGWMPEFMNYSFIAEDITCKTHICTHVSAHTHPHVQEVLTCEL